MAQSFLKAKDCLPGQIRDDSVPDIDDDRNSLPPPLAKLLKLEVEAYDKLEKAMERAGYSKSDTALIFMEVAVRKDYFRWVQAWIGILSRCRTVTRRWLW